MAKTAKKKGVPVDYTGHKARGENAQKWCMGFGLKQSFTSSVKGYTVVEAQTLSEEWGRRMQWFYDQWCGAEGEDFRFTDEVVTAYPETEEFVTWAESLPMGHPGRARAIEVRKLRPLIAPIREDLKKPKKKARCT